MIVQLTAHGVPAAQGSKKLARGRIIDHNPAPLRAWRAVIAGHAVEAMAAAGGPLEGPVELVATFYLPRPQSQWRTGARAGELKDGAPVYSHSRPDLDKLTRAVCDALTDAGVWRDDSQVCVLRTSKRYALAPRSTGVTIRVSPVQMAV